ncbi:hypothetical protein ACFW1A_22540, partial [Kitasatospora sp. NPDC058965]|uniref:hypothetical protein n=1 Tax=Kitasatospora sp. NPDC058965 TaxID=3346682 RepID=UPI00369DF5DE
VAVAAHEQEAVSALMAGRGVVAGDLDHRPVVADSADGSGYDLAIGGGGLALVGLALFAALAPEVEIPAMTVAVLGRAAFALAA